MYNVYTYVCRDWSTCVTSSALLPAHMCVAQLLLRHHAYGGTHMCCDTLHSDSFGNTPSAVTTSMCCTLNCKQTVVGVEV